MAWFPSKGKSPEQNIDAPGNNPSATRVTRSDTAFERESSTYFAEHSPDCSLFSALSGGGALDLTLGFPASFSDDPLPLLTAVSRIAGTVQVDFNFEEAPAITPVPLPASALFLMAGLGRSYDRDWGAARGG